MTALDFKLLADVALCAIFTVGLLSVVCDD